MSNATLTTEQEFIELLLLAPLVDRDSVLIDLKEISQDFTKNLI